MPRFAVISSGIVVNTILADNESIVWEITGLAGVPSETASIGDSYNSETSEFTPPVPEVVEPAEPEAPPAA